MTAGDVIGHEPMGIVEAVGAGVSHVRPGDRVVVPFTISCGDCAMCSHDLQSQCETTQVTEYGSGAALLGYSKLYGQVPGGQAEYLRVPHADYGLIKVGTELPDENYLFLSDILPTAWQAVEYADAPTQGTLAVVGLGPVGPAGRPDRTPSRSGGPRHRPGARAPHDGRAPRHPRLLDLAEDTVGEIREAYRGAPAPDAVVDAVGMEADGSPFAGLAQTSRGQAPRRHRPAAHGECRRRPPRSAAFRKSTWQPHARRHDLPLRGLRRHCQSDAAC